MTPWHGNTFRVTGPLWGGIHRFLWWTSEQTVEQTVELSVVLYANEVDVTLLQCSIISALYYFTDLPRFYVNVSMPTYIKDNEFAIAGLVTAK